MGMTIWVPISRFQAAVEFGDRARVPRDRGKEEDRGALRRGPLLFRDHEELVRDPRTRRRLGSVIWVPILSYPYGCAAMKTTLEISDPLLREARKIATRDHTTLRALA